MRGVIDSRDGTSRSWFVDGQKHSTSVQPNRWSWSKTSQKYSQDQLYWMPHAIVNEWVSWSDITCLLFYSFRI